MLMEQRTIGCQRRVSTLKDISVLNLSVYYILVEVEYKIFLRNTGNLIVFVEIFNVVLNCIHERNIQG